MHDVAQNSKTQGMVAVAKQTHQDNQSAAPDAGAPTRPGRRRLAGAGVAGGVILTLKSPSALGATMCKSASGAMSGGLASRAPTQVVACNGRLPSWWAGQNSPLPPACTTFNKVFPCAANTAAYGNLALMKILKTQACDPGKVGMYLMAAYFNAYTGRTSFLKVPAVVAIWSEWQATGGNLGGTYTPIAGGKKWGSSQIVAYLASTMA